MSEKLDLEQTSSFNVVIVISSLLVVFFAWAYFSNIAQYVSGYGRIIPSGKTRTVQHLEGGIINTILVQEGDRVEKDQPLFIIDNIATNSNRNEAKIKFHQLESRLIRLQAEKNNEDSLVFPENLISDYPNIIVVEEDLFFARRNEFKNKVNGLNEQINQKDLRLDNLRSTRNNLQSELSVAVQQSELNEKLFNGGSVSQSTYLDAQSRVNNFRTRISSVSKEIPITLAEKTEIETKIKEAHNEYQADIIEDISKASFEQKQLLGKIDKFDNQISRSTVTAPVSGILNVRYFDTIGGVVQPGGAMAEILPLEEKLVVEGQVSTKDRPKIYTGLPVTVRSNAFDFRKDNIISGTLQQISADSFTDQQNNSFYKVIVVIDRNSLPKDIELFSGMIVDINIVVDKVSILQILLKPFWDTLDDSLR